MVFKITPSKTNKKGQDEYELFLLSCFPLSKKGEKKERKSSVLLRSREFIVNTTKKKKLGTALLWRPRRTHLKKSTKLSWNNINATKITQIQLHDTQKRIDERSVGDVLSITCGHWAASMQTSRILQQDNEILGCSSLLVQGMFGCVSSYVLVTLWGWEREHMIKILSLLLWWHFFPFMRAFFTLFIWYES